MKRRARVGGHPWAVDLGRIGNRLAAPENVVLY